jgi:hypothetical protein
MIGHRLLGNSLLCVGDFAEGLAHLDRALALYDPAAHRPLATRFGQDIGVAILSFRPFALSMLGYPEIAPRSVRIAVGVWGWSATICMVASRVRVSNLTLPERRSLSTSP